MEFVCSRNANSIRIMCIVSLCKYLDEIVWKSPNAQTTTFRFVVTCKTRKTNKNRENEE